jgi:uncharacterized protein YegL
MSLVGTSATADAPLILLLDRSSSMDEERNKDMLDVLNSAREKLNEGIVHIIPWNNTVVSNERWAPAEQEATPSLITSSVGLTKAGASLTQVIQGETYICPRYLIVVDGTPSDQEAFTDALGSLNALTTVALMVMLHEAHPEVTLRWYREVPTMADYRVYEFNSGEFIRAVQLTQDRCPIS